MIHIFRFVDKRKIQLSAVLLGMGISLSAQTPIKKEVEVVKPYQPVISDAFKINQLPVIADSTVIKPSFDYSITTKRVETGFDVTPINAAKMIGMPLPKLYKTYFRLGLGNNVTTLGDLYINNLRSKKASTGLFFNHHSSTGNVKLENGRKVFAGYSDNNGGLYGRRFLNKAELFGGLGIYNKTVHHYGFKPDIDTSLEKGSIRQNFLNFNAKGGVQSTHADSSKLIYLGQVNYNYTQDKFEHQEHDVTLNASFSRRFTNNYAGLNTSFDLLKRSANLDSSTNAIFNVNPYVLLSTPDYRLQFGFNASFVHENNDNALKLYPRAEFMFNVVKDVIVPFIGVTGQMDNHSYRSIAWENPYIRPDLTVKNTNTKLDIYGGVKGNLGNSSSYVVKASYKNCQGLYFYVNDSSRLWNKFDVAYDDGDVFKLSAEINLDATESLNFHLNAGYYNYSLTRLEYAWHKPDFDLTFNTRYNLKNKIIASLETYYMGKRYASPYTLLGTPLELKGALDLNLYLEYRYTKILSGFIQVRNLMASKYQYWNQYPVQRFTILFGFSYAL